MKVVILSHYFPPDSPGTIPHDVARGLQCRGHEVKVLTTFPHYNSGAIAEGHKQRLNHVETIDGIQVRRVPIVRSQSRNPLGRIANYLSFIASARFAKKFVMDADVFYVHGTPATVSEPARVWSKSLGIPFVYHVQDIWPESVTMSGFLPRRVMAALDIAIGKWLRKVYSDASATVAVAPTARDLLVERGVPAERAHMVFNWSDHLAEVSRPTTQGLTLLYAGTLGEYQDLETVIYAANRMAHLPDFKLLIAGSGPSERKLRKLVGDLKAGDFIRFLGRVDRDQMSSLYARADFQLVPLKNINIFAGTIPSKLQTGFSFGVPVITTVRGDVAALVEENRLGFVAAPGNVDDLATTLFSAYISTAAERKACSERAKEFFEQNFTKEVAIDRIESILVTVVEEHGNAFRHVEPVTGAESMGRSHAV